MYYLNLILGDWDDVVNVHEYGGELGRVSQQGRDSFYNPEFTMAKIRVVLFLDAEPADMVIQEQELYE